MDSNVGSEHLEFLLRHGLTSTKLDPATERLVLTFRQERIRTIFCGLCCFLDTKSPDGLTRKGKKPIWIRSLIVAPTYIPTQLTLDLKRAKGDGNPYTLAVFLPEFWEDASLGKVQETYRIPCFEIPLET